MEEIKKLYEKLCTTDETLTEEERTFIENLVRELKEKQSIRQKTILEISSLLDYDELKKKGKTKEDITRYILEDQATVKEAESYVEENLTLRDTMFGYPANMYSSTAVVEYLRLLESRLYLINSCGGPNDRGNYRMDNKDMEIKIIELVMQNLNIDKENYWGYITSGGTEGNFWGIKSGFDKFPNGVLYFSNAAHYSVSKFVNQNDIPVYQNEIISSTDEKINVKELIQKCKENWEANKKPAIILLSWGTTKTGAIDDVKLIVEELEKLEIPHYIHIDAALFGGIPRNQSNAPVLTNFEELNVDSVSISLHKYIGSSKVNGVIISRKRPKGQFIDYIGQEDSTILGSRDFAAFQVYQRLIDLNERTMPNEYEENINYFIKEAEENGLSYTRVKNSNIFIIDKPSDELCIKYQLATFSDGHSQHAHVIIFPSQKKESISALINDISKEKCVRNIRTLSNN